MVRVVEGNLSAGQYSFGIVVSRFNNIVTQQLLRGAMDCLLRHGVVEEKITVVHCPGAFEIPHVAKQLAGNESVDAVICLGCIIRGETPHFEYIAKEVSRGVGQVALDTGVATAFGVLTTENLEQALERAGAKAGNKGWDAALSAIEQLNVTTQLKGVKH
ncbi:MAG TPA: 6,7-dimethyl-8-ribityllumazine synthase [Bacteroidota bacterium]|jgi:6,7-dimethyl-8-ribityllumazine synthase